MTSLHDCVHYLHKKAALWAAVRAGLNQRDAWGF